MASTLICGSHFILCFLLDKAMSINIYLDLKSHRLSLLTFTTFSSPEWLGYANETFKA